jgi:isocitrate/isopropylmalate dehydrogenase
VASTFGDLFPRQRCPAVAKALSPFWDAPTRLLIPGDDAAPEAVLPSVGVLRRMELDIDFQVLPSGEEGQALYGERWGEVCREAIDATETTLFGSTSGKTPALQHLRWGRDTYANVRPVRYLPGALSPLRDPVGIDFVIVRENSEDLYSGVEGNLELLAPLGLVNRLTRRPIPDSGGQFALKVITEAGSRRIVQFAFELALKRAQRLGRPGKVTLACKYNMLPHTDGLFRSVGRQVAEQFPEVSFEDFIVDDFARRIVAEPKRLDVVVMPNLYGDILTDEAAALVGGLGVAPSACFSADFAYFEPVWRLGCCWHRAHQSHGNATVRSEMIEHLGMGAKPHYRISHSLYVRFWCKPAVRPGWFSHRHRVLCRYHPRHRRVGVPRHPLWMFRAGLPGRPHYPSS